MKYIFYCLLWFSFKSKMNTDGERYRGLHRQGRFTGYVVGGVQVPINMYPHVATPIMNNRTLCGGSIISDRVILTAGHCTVNKANNNKPYPADAFDVYLGASSLSKGVPYKVCKVIPHEKYKPNYYIYDIAVLILRRRIRFGPTIRKIEIARNKSWKNEKYSFTIAGFGMKEMSGGPSVHLLATRMHFVDANTCNQSQAASPMMVPHHMFCMIGQRWTSDCYGDSGSGVIWKRQLVGLVSTGRQYFCGADMVPSMYTDVTFFRDWVQSKVMEADTLTEGDCISKKTAKVNLISDARMELAEYLFFRKHAI